MTRLSPEQKRNRFILIVLIISFIITLIAYFLIGADKIKQKTTLPSNNTLEFVSGIIDGDTFELENGERVRLICIDAPEKGDKGYEESKEFLESLILNKEIRLEKDLSETDRYGRLLRYAYLDTPKNEIFVNKEVFDNGYAKIMIVEPDIKRCDQIKNK